MPEVMKNTDKNYHDMVYDPPICKLLPEYFDDLKEPCPSASDFKKIPFCVNQFHGHFEYTPDRPSFYDPHMIFD